MPPRKIAIPNDSAAKLGFMGVPIYSRAKAMGLDELWVPKTLISAKHQSYAEDIVYIVRKEFGKGNDFCKKDTYRVSGKSEDIITAFRTAPEKRRRLVGVLDGESGANAARRVSRRAEPANQFRIAVTVDMIATGTDIKPLECLLFLRDVRSQLYFEQMKERGTRTIDPDALASVTPDMIISYRRCVTTRGANILPRTIPACHVGN